MVAKQMQAFKQMQRERSAQIADADIADAKPAGNA